MKADPDGKHWGHVRSGLWPDDCLQRAFVEGAKWWQFAHNGATMWGSDRAKVEEEAVCRYGPVVQEQYDELIMHVCRVFPGETRHQTALRYIREAEARAYEGANGHTNTTAAPSRSGKTTGEDP